MYSPSEGANYFAAACYDADRMENALGPLPSEIGHLCYRACGANRRLPGPFSIL
jgi:hypothetical protein